MEVPIKQLQPQGTLSESLVILRELRRGHLSGSLLEISYRMGL
jgi:hypothetical protein